MDAETTNIVDLTGEDSRSRPALEKEEEAETKRPKLSEEAEEEEDTEDSSVGSNDREVEERENIVREAWEDLLREVSEKEEDEEEVDEDIVDIYGLLKANEEAQAKPSERNKILYFAITSAVDSFYKEQEHSMRQMWALRDEMSEMNDLDNKALSMTFDKVCKRFSKMNGVSALDLTRLKIDADEGLKTGKFHVSYASLSFSSYRRELEAYISELKIALRTMKAEKENPST